VTFSFTYFIFEKKKKGERRVCEIEMIDCLRLVTFSFTYFIFEKKKKERGVCVFRKYSNLYQLFAPQYDERRERGVCVFRKYSDL